MNAIQGAALAADPQQAPSSSGQPDGGIPYGSYGGTSGGAYGSGGAGGAGNSGGGGGGWSGGNWSGGGGYQPPKRSRRIRRGVAMGAAGVALAAAVAVGWYDAAQPSGSTAGKATTSATTTLTKAQLTAKVSPGLVDINTTLGYSNEKAAGTGMVLTSTGEILTNNHVIDGATSISVTDVGNGKTYTATVVGYDATKDIAVLQLQDASNLQTVTLGSSSSVSVGQTVVAIGNAEGKGGTPSAVSGTVTALGQSITASDEGSGNSEQLSGLIQSNAPIEPGDSGGSLVNSSGQVIGMDTAASSTSASPTSQGFTPGQSGQSGQSGENGQSSSGSSTAATQAFSIPISEAETVAAQITAGTASSTVHIGSTGFLGVEVSAASGSSGTGGTGTGGTGTGGYGGYGYGGYGYGGGSGTTTSGATVIGTVSGSPAATSGLAAGDVITSVAGQTVTTSSQISSILATYRPGDKVSVSWTDTAGQSHTASISLATGPAA
ncbi:MAG TPA: trypsin-like peptidase domain-containing protein [Streptosporangiaceae bacterium]|nr:trypsin-like peptidase domain-containing protein [Streptosporangiaceae bacterium]